MTTNDRDNELEAPIRKLFDASAEDLSGATLTKLTARAAEVSIQRVPAVHRFPRWAWASGLSAMAACAAALAMALGSWLSRPNEHGPAARALEVAMVPSPREARPRPQAGPALERGARPDWGARVEASADTGLIADLDLGWEDESPSEIEVDSLSGPEPEADLDAWLFATNKLLEGS
jgi:hypothetical protein